MWRKKNWFQQISYFNYHNDHFHNSPQLQNIYTYRLRHTTTSCWFWWRGRGALVSACGKRLYHSSWPSTCWHKYGQPLTLLMTTVHTHQKLDAHTEKIHLPWPSSSQDQRYGSSDLQNNSQNVLYIKWHAAKFIATFFIFYVIIVIRLVIQYIF